MKRISSVMNLFFVSLIVVGLGIVAFAFAQSMMAGMNSSLVREAETTGAGLQLLGAGIATIGMLGAGIGQGYAAGKAAEGVSRNPEAESKIRNMMIVGAAIAETSALYCFVISVLLIFVA